MIHSSLSKRIFLAKEKSLSYHLSLFTLFCITSLRANGEMLIPHEAGKKIAIINFKKNPSQGSTAVLKESKANLQREVRFWVNRYWVHLSNTIQKPHDRRDMDTVFCKMKLALGPPIVKCTLLKSVNEDLITDKNNQLAWWVQHYSLLCSKEDNNLTFADHNSQAATFDGSRRKIHFEIVL